MFNKGLQDKARNIDSLRNNVKFIKKSTKRKITKVPVNQTNVSKDLGLKQ